MPIQSFADARTEVFFRAGKVPTGTAWASIRHVVTRKLDMLDYARSLDDLRSPPGNRLKALKGRLAGLHSIRVNDQWRIVFRWSVTGPAEVQIADYHRG